MRILFLSHYFPPEVNAPATRTFEHCREWVKLGHQVTVISCVPHHPKGRVYPGYRNKWFQVEYKEGIKAVKVLTYVTANEGFVKRTLNYVFYMIMAIVVAPFLGKADVVISTSPQFFNGLAGYFVSRMKNCPWVLEIRDLWPESIVAVGAVRNRFLIQCLSAIERFVYRKADRVVPVTYSFKRHIEAHGGNADTITVIRNGVDLNLFTPCEPERSFAEKIGVDGKFVAAYVGTHGMAHGLEVMVSAAEALRSRKDIVFLLVGDGAERENLQSLIRQKGLDNILLLGQLPKQDMPKLWSISDVSLVHLRKLDLFLTVIPSKIFESMAMCKPLILGVRGESQEIVEQASAGITIEPENARQLATAVEKLADSPRMAREFGQSGRRYVVDHFDRAALAKMYETVLLSTQKAPLENSVRQ